MPSAPGEPNSPPHSVGRGRGGDELPPLVFCPHCDRTAPAGDFCGHCGAHLTTADPTRHHAFAAVPSEGVLHFNLISTLFPHLPHRRGSTFRLALVAGGAVVVALAALHLFAPATAAATFLLPALYLLYVYEVEVYEDEPWLVVGVTMVAGAILGYGYSTLAGGGVSHMNLTGDTSNAFLLGAVVTPIMAQILMLAGPLVLFQFRSRFREPLDGITFGAASALGFTLMTTLTSLWPVIIGPLVASGQPLDWSLRLLRLGVLVSMVNASTTALVAAASWLHRYERRPAGRPWQSSVLVALVVAFGSQLALGVLDFVLPDLVTQVLVWSLATVGLVLYLRLVIHQSLLAEGAGHEIGPDAPCPECQRVVPTMLFCPACGVSRAATGKAARVPAGFPPPLGGGLG